MGAAYPIQTRDGAPVVARTVSGLAKERTGIDIHPGATIGPSFFVEYGTGVVIGEAAIVGRVRIGAHATIGGNVWVRHDVRPHMTILQPRAVLRRSAEIEADA